jgi:hypothetical protein
MPDIELPRRQLLLLAGAALTGVGKLNAVQTAAPLIEAVSAATVVEPAIDMGVFNQAVKFINMTSGWEFRHQVTKLEHVINAELPPNFAKDDSAYEKDLAELAQTYSGRLSIAWRANIELATDRWDQCETLQSFLFVKGEDLNPRLLFELLQDETVKKQAVASAISVLTPSNEKESENLKFFQEEFEHTLAWLERYPHLRQAHSLEDIIQCLREEIREALSLPLENGVFNRFFRTDNIIPNAETEKLIQELNKHRFSIELEDLLKGGDLEKLLEEVPELFPPSKLPLIRALVENLKENGGQQKISLEELSKSIDAPAKTGHIGTYNGQGLHFTSKIARLQLSPFGKLIECLQEKEGWAPIELKVGSNPIPLTFETDPQMTQHSNDLSYRLGLTKWQSTSERYLSPI